MSENGLSSARSEIGIDVRVRASNLPVKRAAFAAYGLVSLMFIAMAQLHGADGPSPVGSYTLRGLREVGSELVIRADGHFEYMLAYGAYDEIAKGTWKLDGQRLLLNSEGEDKPAQFTLKRSDNRPEPGIFVVVNNKNGRGIAGIDVILLFDGNQAETGYTQSYGFELALSGNRFPRAIGLGLRMYNLEPQWTQLSDNKRNVFFFEFDPGDLGQAKFRDQSFQWQGNTLTTERNGQVMRYVKE